MSICVRDTPILLDSSISTLVLTATRKDIPLNTSVAKFWSNLGITNSQSDCEYGYRVTSHTDLLTFSQTSTTYDNDVTTINLLATQWSQVTTYSTILEMYFVNYDSSVARASFPVTFEILPNCENE